MNSDDVIALAAQVASADRVVCFTTANCWYIDSLVKNLLVSAAIYEPDLKLAVFATDDAAAALCRARHFPFVVRVRIPVLQTDNLAEGTDCSTDGYTRLSFAKVILCDALLSRGFIPLFLDPDMAFKRSGSIADLLSYLSLSSAPCALDFVCAGDREYMNSNILLATPTARELFACTRADVEAVVRAPDQHGDEDLFRPRLRATQLRWTTVARDEYPQGCDKAIDRARLIHANCVRGLPAKVALLRARDAWYLPADALSLSLRFAETHAVHYPFFLEGDLFEMYFLRYVARAQPFLKRRYLNVTWTNLYCNQQFCEKPYDSARLQHELDALPPRRYFTVLQFDEPIRERLPPNTLVFGCCAGDVPIPLTYESSALSCPRAEKDIFCSFIGSITHPLRARLVEHLASLDRERYQCIVASDQYDLFLEKSAASKFCLAPRGFGRASFRFYEVLKLGSVPVYIWDDVVWLPWADLIDYKRLCVVLHESELAQLDAVLEAITAEEYEDKLRYYKEIRSLFTYEGMCAEIIRRVNSS